MKVIINFTFSFLVYLCFPTMLFSQELKLGSLFQEHMVLQRDMPIAIWGQATPNTTVTVTLGNFKVTTNTDSDGDWKATLPNQEAGGPHTFSASSRNESIVFKDVMIGEVWICSGQSNMAWSYQGIPEIKSLEQSTHGIRTFEVTKTVAFKEQQYLDGGTWTLDNPSSAVAFSFSHYLQQATGVTVGIILTAWGSSSIEGWMPRDMTKKLPHFNEIMQDFDTNPEKRRRIDSILELKEKRSRVGDILLRTQPNIIYNTMMKPLAPFTSRGIVWYQGEANTKSLKDMKQYGKTLPLWINRLRDEWGQESFHFLIVALPGFVGKDGSGVPLLLDSENPTEPSWAWMRESQYKALDLPNTAVATTIDLGEKYNIHPKDKLPVGYRLALLAQKSTLKVGNIAEGPKMKSIKTKGGKMTIEYDNAVGLKTTDGKSPKAFWLADNSGKWHQAKAKIKGKKIILSAADLTNPLYVRYAFSAKPEVNLVNAAGLPARPFRTDDFRP